VPAVPEDVGIEFGAASAADILAARELFARAFGRPADEARWRRKYFANPAGPVVAFAAKDGERLVSFAAQHPAPFTHAGRRLTLYQLGDSMTDPAYRRRGWQVFLKRLACDWLRLEGATFMLSFPNAGSLTVNRRLGYVRLGRLRRWFRPAGGPPPAAPAALAVTEVACDDERLTRVGAAAAAGPFTAGVRDAAWLSWRFGERPGVRCWLAGDADGYLVAERAARGVWVRDLAAAPPGGAAVAALLRACVAFARADGAAHVSFAHLGWRWSGALLRAGFIPLPGGAPVLVVACAPLAREWRRRGRWFLTDADRDLDCAA
jgi:GNAT superfamily N-acetyltransferase